MAAEHPCPVEGCAYEDWGETALVYHLAQEHPETFPESEDLGSLVIPDGDLPPLRVSYLTVRGHCSHCGSACALCTTSRDQP